MDYSPKQQTISSIKTLKSVANNYILPSLTYFLAHYVEISACSNPSFGPLHLWSIHQWYYVVIPWICFQKNDFLPVPRPA
jgi:hypothetical protein